MLIARWIALSVGLVTALGIFTPAYAVNPRDYRDMHQYYRDLVAEQAKCLDESRRELEAKPTAAWTAEDVDGYLIQAYWTVCEGLQRYLYENQCLPESTQELAATEYIPAWPGNPLHAWAPMKVLAVEDGYCAGELVLQICPPEYYSGLVNPVPRSFELAVYGRDVEAKLPPGYDPGIAKPWVIVPKGVLILGGTHTESSASLRKKWARMKQQQKGNDIQN